MFRRFLRATWLTLTACVALAFATTARAESWRQAETGPTTIRGTWTWDADRKHYVARWENGASATIRIDSLDAGQAILTRVDSPSSASAGLTARYTGRRQGDTFSGTVTWSWHGRRWSGTWRADLVAASPSGAVTLQRAYSLFNTMVAQPDIAFEYPWDGCYARTHLMVRRLQRMGVQPGKVWSFSNGDSLTFRTKRDARGYVEWQYHVAPTVPVIADNGKTISMVIDPSMFDRPVTVHEWLNAQRRSSDGPWPKYCLTRIGEAPILANGARAAGSGYWISADPSADLDAHALSEMRRFRTPLRRAG